MSDLAINKIQATPSYYAECSGSITIDVQGGKKPYRYSIDNGMTYGTSHFIDVYGGTYIVVVRDANNNTTKPKEVVVTKVLSELQANYLDKIYDCFGNESQAAMQTEVVFIDAVGVTHRDYLKPKTAKAWKADPDFAQIVAEIKLDAGSYFKDYCEAKLIQHIDGGFPIIQWVAAPEELDELGNNKNKGKRVPIQVGQTLPSEKSLHFVLERKFKEDYSLRQEITGANGSGRIVALMLDSEFLEEEADSIEKEESEDLDSENNNDTE